MIPIDVGNKLRLYCLRLSDKILVFGNGGVKAQELDFIINYDIKYRMGDELNEE